MKLIYFILCTSIAVAQTVYEIPFPKGTDALQGNIIELSVLNKSTIPAEEIKVETTNAPKWLKFSAQQVVIEKLNAKEEQTASFVFFIEKQAEVNKEQTLNFRITDKGGQTWTKEIKIKVLPPATFELFQNYPNPFNPSTVISFQLSVNSNVSLKVYDVIGREVATLVSDQQEAGYHEVRFNAQKLSSGVYFYQLTVTDEQNKNQIFKKKMLLLR
jgi:hypothetical protein